MKRRWLWRRAARSARTARTTCASRWSKTNSAYGRRCAICNEHYSRRYPRRNRAALRTMGRRFHHEDTEDRERKRREPHRFSICHFRFAIFHAGLRPPSHAITLPRPMKAERRHELQENSLARWIDNLPIAARLYADKILLVIIAVLLVVVLIRWRIMAAEQRVEGAAESLASARLAIRDLTNRPALGPPEQLAQLRTTLRGDAETNIERAITDGSDKDATLRSEALLT